MKIEVIIQDRPLQLNPVILNECGAVVRFDGTVRGIEDNQPIAGLRYEAYRPMAENTIRQLLVSIHEDYPFELARVHHRIGWVPVGEAAIIMDVHSHHRLEAIRVVETFMNRLKQDVPIWKRSATFNDPS